MFNDEKVNPVSLTQKQYIKQGKPFSMLNHVDFLSPLVILPPKYLEEVRSAPQTKLSFPLSLEKVGALLLSGQEPD